MNIEDINKIVDIGKKEVCTKKDLNDLSLISTDSCFQLRDQIWFNFKKLNIQNLKNFIKGFHLIEKQSGGFGSVSATIKMIYSLSETKDQEEVYNWVAFNGGNYYIPEHESFKEMRERKEWEKETYQEKLLNDKKIRAEKIKQRKRKEEQHSKISNKAKQLYEEQKEKLSKMANEELVEVYNKEVGNTNLTTESHRLYSALKKEFEERNIDITVVKKGKKLSFGNKIKLVGKKLEKT